MLCHHVSHHALSSCTACNSNTAMHAHAPAYLPACILSNLIQNRNVPCGSMHLHDICFNCGHFILTSIFRFNHLKNTFLFWIYDFSKSCSGIPEKIRVTFLGCHVFRPNFCSEDTWIFFFNTRKFTKKKIRKITKKKIKIKKFF